MDQLPKFPQPGMRVIAEIEGTPRVCTIINILSETELRVKYGLNAYVTSDFREVEDWSKDEVATPGSQPQPTT